jgi:Plasmid pRiA4b ORF-3-like protein
MPKKKRTKRSGHPGRATHLTVVGQTSTADTALIVRFNTWYRQHAVGLYDHQPPEKVRELITLLFEIAARRGLPLGQPVAPVLEQLLNLFENEPDLVGAAGAIVDVLDHYLDFLAETDSWTGSEDEYIASRELLLPGFDTLEPESILPDLMAGLDELPEVPVAEQLEALEGMAPISAVGTLLDWIGQGKPVTSTGALRLADVGTVAAMLGIRAVGQRGAPVPFRGLFAEDLTDADLTDAVLNGEAAPDAGPVPVGSMWDLIELERWWPALEGVGVIEITPTRVRPGLRTGEWRAADPARALGIRKQLLGLYLEAWFGPGTAALLPALIPYAMLHSLSQLAAAVSPAVHPERSSEAIMEQMSASAPPTGALDLGRVAALTTEQAMRHLRSMRMLSATVATDGHDRYVVAEGARPAFADAIRSIRTALTDWIGIDNESQHEPGTVLRIKVALVDSKPAVWRRVTIAANAPLAELHDIIQLVFGWTNSHLHQFIEGDDWYGGDVIFSDPDFQEFFDDEIEDEYEIAIGALLADPGDELRYLYDFGDGWRHIIRLEGIEASAAYTAPRCIGGRGMSPLDDAGGVRGWSEKVRVSQDPTDPDYTEVRDWLGLAPGEVLDPASFDVAEADAALLKYNIG